MAPVPSENQEVEATARQSAGEGWGHALRKVHEGADASWLDKAPSIIHEPLTADPALLAASWPA